MASWKPEQAWVVKVLGYPNEYGQRAYFTYVFKTRADALQLARSVVDQAYSVWISQKDVFKRYTKPKKPKKKKEDHQCQLPTMHSETK